MSKWEELEKAARAATPGPWKASFTKLSDVTAENGALIAKCARLDSLTRLEANARYIAAANPSAILELLAERDALKAELENVRRAFEQHKDNWLSWQAKRKGLEDAAAELDRIRAMEPVAWLFQHEETGLTECVDAQQVEWGFEKSNPRWKKVSPLYTLEKP